LADMARESDLNATRNRSKSAKIDLSSIPASGPPLVSVVTPSFNQARFLRSTLESVALQRYPRLEHIVVDGASTDGSVEILKAFSVTHPHVRWVSEPDEGQADAFNRGFRMATGDIFGWLNSDDLYCVDAIPIAVHSLEQNPELDMIYGDAWLIDERGRIRRPWDFIEDSTRADCARERITSASQRRSFGGVSSSR
jgi:glycosyltransferase involved in cell wall biosynthesis